MGCVLVGEETVASQMDDEAFKSNPLFVGGQLV
jgi:hypothetical protein